MMSNYYFAGLKSSGDYYPFGSSMKERKYQAGGYRYGFNGKERNIELNGDNYDFGARLVDTRLGRWWSLDKVKSPWFSHYQYTRNNPIRFNDPDGNYERDAHYYTVYMVGIMLGLNPKTAEQLARGAELPDTDINGQNAQATNTWMNVFTHDTRHVLNGGWAPTVRGEVANQFLNAPTDNNIALGELLHAFGDTYAHIKMDGDNPNATGFLYDQYTGHAGADDNGHAPDLVMNRPELYKKYVSDLGSLLQKKFGLATPINMFMFEKMANYAAKNKVSLIGIASFELMRAKGGEKSFFVHQVKGAIGEDAKANYMKHVQDVKNYMKSEYGFIEGEHYYTKETYDSDMNVQGTQFEFKSNVAP